jgi:hypothetical protein
MALLQLSMAFLQSSNQLSVERWRFLFAQRWRWLSEKRWRCLSDIDFLLKEGAVHQVRYFLR